MRHSKQRRGKLGMLLAVPAFGVALGLFGVLSGCDLFTPPYPHADFEVSEKPRPRVEVTFTNTSTDPNGFDDLREFFWEFGDGETADSMNATHKYKRPDDYMVKLTVYDAAGCADTCQKEVHCISTVFAEPKTEDEVLGSKIIWDKEKGKHTIPHTKRYNYDPTEQAWIVCYPGYQAPDGYWYIVPENIAGLIPVRFVEDLSQPIVLELSWQLMTETKEVLYEHRYPEEFSIRDPSQTDGVMAAWDLWGQKEHGAYFSPGRYEMRLEIRETNTSDIFVWYFPFIVLWGEY